MLKKLLSTTTLFIGLTSFVNATIVEFQTSQGNFQVNLFDQTTPNTVDNFLKYVDEQHYTNSVVHRVSPDFVVQGGGFTFEGEWPLTRIDTSAPVINEPVYSNVKGTIAMAKSSDPNSATDQWFFNLVNNASNLDVQNSGFTVFGQVIGDGMSVIEKIAQLKLCNSGSLIGIPMVVDNDDQQCADLGSPSIENFVTVEQVIIIDSSEVTDAGLNPVKNTLLTTPTVPTPTPTPDSSGGGGALHWFSILTLLLLSVRKLAVQK
jgi:peptidyl-prolyl cis-trans isomerase A (cyclophilin A)